MTRIPTKGGDEVDAFSKRARKWLSWRPGQRKHLKRKYNKRFRQLWKRECDQ